MSEFTTKTFQSKAGKLVYQKLIGGNKDAVIIYIHGLFPISFRFGKEFADQYQKYAHLEYTLLIPHLIGFGDSEKPDNLDVYTMENQGQYLYNLLLSENVYNVIIMASSMGGPIAISLIDKIKNSIDEKMIVKGLFYLEGNLDKNDTFFSSRIANYPFEQYKEQFYSWIDDLIKKSQPERIEILEGYRVIGPFALWGTASDLVRLSEGDQLLPHLQQLIDFPAYFFFGEKNKGRFTSESLVKEAKLPLIYIPNAGHGVRVDNPEGFWKVVKELLKSCL
ncbi:MAG: alpha/beta fold hydrolase [Promethearchaeota archaeon]